MITCTQSLSTIFSIVFCILINKTIFISSLAFILSIRSLLLSLISLKHRSRKMSSLRLGSGDFDVVSQLFCAVVLVSESVVELGPSGFEALACACATTCALSDMNSFTNRYQRHFSDRCEPNLIFIALFSL